MSDESSNLADTVKLRSLREEDASGRAHGLVIVLTQHSLVRERSNSFIGQLLYSLCISEQFTWYLRVPHSV